ncbi:Aste57867_12872 [Aphanomyces stellatus]|uniref:Aste57867_12872 protein n=1 Tax=Aphanomyces stellatus TaxID=120398 RepID=A0A485KWR5_9STRA|nr:hypothetical protein As57867_012824 [Aphanomyces stellatus]VFT89719.1 Aste57867_12872 [Aphanomyces stellatus]
MSLAHHQQPASRHSLSPPHRVVKTGTLFKKGSGHGLLFHRHNWKARYVVLTTDSLSYYDHQDGHLKGSIDLSACTLDSLQVMPADCRKTGHSAASEWRLAIDTASRRFFVAAACERDMRAWIDALASVFRANEMRRQSLVAATLRHAAVSTC